MGEEITSLEDLQCGMKVSALMIDEKATLVKVKLATSPQINISGIVYKNYLEDDVN